MSRVVVADKVAPAGLDVLRQAGHEVVELDGRRARSCSRQLRDADALLVRSATKVDRGAARGGAAADGRGAGGRRRGQRGRACGHRAGHPRHQRPDRQRGLRGRAHVRASPRASSPRSRRGRFDGSRAGGRSRSSSESELAGKTLGIVGLGQVGSRVAVRARAFEAKVARARPVPAAREGQGDGRAARAAAGASRALRHRHASRHGGEGGKPLLGREEFARMRQGSILVNVARGKPRGSRGAARSPSVRPACRSGARRLRSGAARRRRSACCKLPNVVATPHLGASTVEAQERVSLQTVEAVAEALAGATYVPAVNLPFRGPTDADGRGGVDAPRRAHRPLPLLHRARPA